MVNCSNSRSSSISNLERKVEFFLPLLISSLVGIFIFLYSHYNFVLLFFLVGILIFSIFLLNRTFLIYGILLTLFLEAHVFSFFLEDVRIRISQLLELIAIFCIFLAASIRKTYLRKTPLDFPLWSYILVNFISLSNAVWIRRSIKIALLLFSLSLLYYVVVNLINSPKVFDRAFNFLLYIGVAEIIYGLYQVLAGMLNWLFNLNLPIGHLGMVHTRFIGSKWGRPYGTFVEPDWYGIICMFYALIFLTLYYSTLKERKFYFSGMVISLLGLFFSFVRSAWLGFIGGAIFLLIHKKKCKLLKLSLSLYIKNTLILLFLLSIATLLFSPLRVILKERFFSNYSGSRISLENVRAKQMIMSFKAFLKHPMLGNGPGSACFDYLAEEYGEDTALEMINNGEVDQRSCGFNPGIITTVLEDTGLIGLILFLIFIRSIISYNFKMIPFLSDDYSLKTLALLGGLVGLFVSYLFTQGFWLPFSWVFLAFNISAIQNGLQYTIRNVKKGIFY